MATKKEQEEYERNLAETLNSLPPGVIIDSSTGTISTNRIDALNDASRSETELREQPDCRAGSEIDKP